jgi:hypothetical protein
MPAPSQLPPQSATEPNPKWTIVFADEPAFKSFLKDFNNSENDHVWINTEIQTWMQFFGTVEQPPSLIKPLGKGLFEMRLRRNPRVLVRIFFYIEPGDVINVVWFYDKKKNSSLNFQQKQIKRARARH